MDQALLSGAEQYNKGQQEGTDAQKFQPNMRKDFSGQWLSTGTHREGVDLPHFRYSEPLGHSLVPCALGWPHSSREGGTDDPL